MGRESRSDICSNRLMSSGGQPKVGLRYEGVCRLVAVTCSPLVGIWGLWWGHFLVRPLNGLHAMTGEFTSQIYGNRQNGKSLQNHKAPICHDCQICFYRLQVPRSNHWIHYLGSHLQGHFLHSPHMWRFLMKQGKGHHTAAKKLQR